MIKIPLKTKPVTVGIDFSNGWIKISQAEFKAGQMRLADISAVQLPLGPDEKNAQKVPQKEFNKLLWAALRLKPKNVISCLPRHLVTVRFLRLPSTNEAEISKMLEFQATKQLPFLKEDIVTGYRILGVEEGGYTKAMFVIAQKNILNNHFDMLKSAGLLADSVCLSTEAILNCFLHNGARYQGAGLYLLIDIDYLFTELLICENDTIVFSRAFQQGAASLVNLQNAGDAEKWVGGLTEEIRRSLAAFKKEAKEEIAVKRIFVQGGVSGFFKSIREGLAGEFNASVEFIDVLEKYKAMRDIQQAAAELADKPISFSSPLGMMLDTDGLKIDLLPPDLKEKRLYKQKRTELLRVYILSIAILICLLSASGGRFYYKQAYLKYIDRELAQIKPEVKKAEALAEKLNVIKGQAGINSSPAEILKQVYSVLPADINLSGLSLGEGRAVILRGTSRAMSNVFEAVASLENSGYFKNVKVGFANKKKVQTEEIVDFQINCGLK